MTRTVVALYCDSQNATRAREELVATGFYTDGGLTFAGGSTPGAQSPSGLTDRLSTLGVPAERAGAYAEGVRRGGTLLMLGVPDKDVETVRLILDRHHPMDLDRSMTRWRTEGWSGYSAAAAPFDDTQILTERKLTEQDSIDLVEEEVKVGKREVTRGGVRVRAYVVENTVHEDVVLREEHVRVDREVVNERISPQAAEAAFVESSFELTERGEEAIVSKEARITGRVHIGKEVEHRTEHITETERRQEVDVDHFGAYENEFRSHYDTNYKSSGIQFEDYRNAYQLGHTYGGDQRYQDFDSSENELRTQWESKHASVGPWQKVKDAVRHAFDRRHHH